MSTQNANKAALFSAIIFPGAGLWWLKSYVRACIFIVPASIALIYIVQKVYAVIAPVNAKYQRLAQEGLINPLDFIGNYQKLSTEVHQNLAAQQEQFYTVGTILILCWLCSIVSSYFVGRQLDQKIHDNKSAS